MRRVRRFAALAASPGRSARLASLVGAPKWIFGTFIQFAYSVAVESFLIHLKDGAR